MSSSRRAALWIAALGMEDGRAVAYAAPARGGVIERDSMPPITPLPQDYPEAIQGALANLCRWMEHGYLGQLWIHPSWYEAAALDLPDAAAAFLEPDDEWEMPTAMTTPRQESGPWLRCRRRDVPHAVWQHIVITALETRAPWREAADARELLAAVLAYNSALGSLYLSSPGATGTRVIRETHDSPQAAALLTSDHLPAITKEPIELDMVWTRQLARRELSPERYLHSYDKNGMYLSACSSVQLGIGEAAAFNGVAARALVDGGAWLPGYWRVDVMPGRAYLPDPFRPTVSRAEEPGPIWLTTPAVQLAADLRMLGAIHEAWLWPEHHRMLEGWYKRLRVARLELLAAQGPAARVALGALKQTYRMGIGWLDGYWLEAGDELLRPDWRHQIVAMARANFYRNLLLLAAIGRYPAAVNIDCVYVLSDDPDARADCPACWHLGTGLGEFKIRDSVQLADVPRATLAALTEEDARARGAGLRDLLRWLGQVRGE